jgi:cytochrome c553
MKAILFSKRLSWLSLSIFVLTACSSIDGSRSVNNASISGRTLAAQVCSTCHGVTGESTSPNFPKLNGQQKEYLVAQLDDFKGHVRSDERAQEHMWGFTRLTPAQITELADYFAGQTPMRGKSVSPPAVARGEVIFSKGLPDLGVVQCSTCHGNSGEGNGTFPRLAGQHANYLIQQIEVFQQTEQRPRGGPMKVVTHGLTEADTVAVAQYLESLGAAK